MNELQLSQNDRELLMLIRSLKGCLLELDVMNDNASLVRLSIPEAFDTKQTVQWPTTDREMQLITLIRGLGFGKIVVEVSNGEILDLPYKQELIGGFKSIKLGVMK